MNKLLEATLGHQYSISERSFKQRLINALGSTEAARVAFAELETSGDIQFQQINARTRFVGRSGSYIDRIIELAGTKVTEQSAYETKTHYAYCISSMSHAVKWPYLWRLMCWVRLCDVYF